MEGAIDVWWIINDGGLMILMSYFLKQHRIWRKCHLRLFLIGDDPTNSERDKEKLNKILYKLGFFG